MGSKAASPDNEVLREARQWTRCGFFVIPLPRGEKGPRLNAWQKLRLIEADLPRYFRADQNLGLLLGDSNRGLTDIDLDCPQAMHAAEAFLPQTGLIHSRKSKPRSHWWYLADPIPKPEKFCDVDGNPGTTLIELRSTGQQTVIPPSVHPSGELLVWADKRDPARVDGHTLRAGSARLAAAALLARHWPAPGSRHDAALALAGFLLRAGWQEEQAMAFVETVAQAAGDEEYRSRAGDVRTTARRLAENGAATGGPRLVEIMGKVIVDRASTWLGLKRNLGEQELIDGGPYVIDQGRICVVRMKEHGPVKNPLCNFAARVSEEVVLDDGVETSRAFTLEGQLATGERLPPVCVAASRFTGMAWVPEQWGLAAIVSAGPAARDQLREAIQRLSPNPAQRKVFTHTGWRQIEGRWVYLTTSGAVGHDGFEVDLGPDLAPYLLPTTPENPCEAMRASLRLLDLAPLTITAPLWAAIFRAPLTVALAPDLSLWLEGPTGSLKSTIAALFLSHFGRFEHTHLPGSWESTPNLLEHRAFILKDIVFVIDDYAPRSIDARDLETKASRVLRAQGNLTGRGRLRSDLTERPTYPPRGLIVSTGEQHPPGQSLLARVLVVQIERQRVNLAALTQAQVDAAQLPHAMAGYVLWLAPQMESLHATLADNFRQARASVRVVGDHLRIPGAIVHLWIGLECGLRYAEEIGAVSCEEARELRTKCWSALLALGAEHSGLIEGETPSLRFLRVLAAMLTQGQARLLPRLADSREAKPPEGLVGWYDEAAIYLIPDAVFAAVGHFCRDSGEAFPVRQERLLRDLSREGLSECGPGRYTNTVRLGGHVRRVLKLSREAVNGVLGEEIVPAGVTTVTGFGE